MSYIRPNPPVDYLDAWGSNLGTQTNNNKVVAGQGITIKRGANGTIIQQTNELDPIALNFTGPYNFSSSYQPNDVVFVDPNVTYYNQSGSAISFTIASGSNPPIAAGLFVCINYIGPLGYDSNMLVNYVAPAYASSSQVITSTVADTYRHYSLNTYYPVYPVLSSSSVTYVSESYWTTVTSQSYWSPLCLYSTSTIQSFTVTSESYNYIVGTSSAGSINIAKPFYLRGFIAVTTSSQGFNQEIYPPYITSSATIIYATIPLGGTGVTGSAWLDINVDARVLMTSLGTCEVIAGVQTAKNRWFNCSNYF